MKHIIYKITNLINERFYIGMHSTKNIDDGYLGSGRRIKAEVKKYGKENFQKEILEYAFTRKVLEEREAQIVNDELLRDPLCLNLKNGGEGGGIWYGNPNSLLPFKDPEVIARRNKKTAETIRKRRENDEYRLAFSKKLSDAGKNNKSFLGKQHTEETKNKMALSHVGKHDGEKNSQFGKCWVHKDGISKSIPKNSLLEFIAQGYIKGRKMNKGVLQQRHQTTSE